MKNHKKSLVLLFLSVLAFVLGACGQEDPRALAEEPYEAQEFMLGTLVSVQVFDEGGEEGLNAALDRIAELDGRFSATNEDSEISAVNQAAGQEPVQVSEEVFYVVEESLRYAEESSGRFDPTIGALTDLWGIGQEDAQVPSQEEIDQALELVDYSSVEMNEETQTIYLPREGMKLDLGAIAKGYITDAATQTLVDHGVTTAIVDLGGDIFVLGASNRSIDDPWRVGIQNPFGERGEILGIVPVHDESVVTSGIYERVLEQDGETYHHLLNPQTGYPFDNELAGLSLVAPSALEGDALATSVFSMGLEEGLSYVNSLEDVEAVFITKEQEIYLSDGYEDEFELTDDSFEWVEQ